MSTGYPPQQMPYEERPSRGSTTSHFAVGLAVVLSLGAAVMAVLAYLQSKANEVSKAKTALASSISNAKTANTDLKAEVAAAQALSKTISATDIGKLQAAVKALQTTVSGLSNGQGVLKVKSVSTSGDLTVGGTGAFTGDVTTKADVKADKYVGGIGFSFSPIYTQAPTDVTYGTLFWLGSNLSMAFAESGVSLAEAKAVVPSSSDFLSLETKDYTK